MTSPILRKDGRWATILRHLGPAPVTVDLIVEAIDTGRYPLWRLREKVRSALAAMSRLGLVQARGSLWRRTAVGQVAIEVLDAPDAPPATASGGRPCDA